MQRAMASGQRISEVLDVPVDVSDKHGAVTLSRDMDGSVEFRNVTFGYRQNLPVLKNVSFRVNPGETVALVGPTGSGKSSSHGAGAPLLRCLVGRRCWSAGMMSAT